MTNTLNLESTSITSSPIPIDSNKRARSNEKALSEEEINAIVNILGNHLLIVKKLIMVEKGKYNNKRGFFSLLFFVLMHCY